MSPRNVGKDQNSQTFLILAMCFLPIGFILYMTSSDSGYAFLASGFIFLVIWLAYRRNGNNQSPDNNGVKVQS